MAGTTRAWTPGPTIVRKCPKCSGIVLEMTSASGNTIGARLWTDGKFWAPMLPDRPMLAKCPHCAWVFWIEKSDRVGVLRLGDTTNQYSGAKWLDKPTEDDYYALANSGTCGPEEEEYVRVQGFWASNDARRFTDTTLVAQRSPAARRNLKQLYNLLPESQPDSRVLKAEIAREIGDFDSCLSLLNYQFEKEYLKTVSLIRTLAEKRDSIVAEIKLED